MSTAYKTDLYTVDEGLHGHIISFTPTKKLIKHVFMSLATPSPAHTMYSKLPSLVSEAVYIVKFLIIVGNVNSNGTIDQSTGNPVLMYFVTSLLSLIAFPQSSDIYTIFLKNAIVPVQAECNELYIYINNFMTRFLIHSLSDVILTMVIWDCYSRRSVHRLRSKHYTLYYVIIVHNYAVNKLCTSAKLKLFLLYIMQCKIMYTILTMDSMLYNRYLLHLITYNFYMYNIHKVPCLLISENVSAYSTYII